MRAIIIQDTDAQALLDQLKLELFTLSQRVGAVEADAIAQMHRCFHYRVTCWLQAQGATGLHS